MNPENVHWEDEIARRYLMEKGGSKSGSHAFLQETQPGLREHLPSGTVYLAPGEDLGRILERIDSSRGKIVRACHPLDVFGMVDVIPSEPEVRGEDAVRKAIERVRAESAHPDVADYVEYETGKPFDNQVGILIQDYNEGQSGSIIEHPHQRGVFRIAHGFSEYTCTDEDAQQPIVREAIGLYRKIQETGLMPSSHSFQMEWGRGDGKILFYQARLFKPYEPPADFDLDELSRGLGEDYFDITRPFDTFGLTGPNGTEVMHRADLSMVYSAPNPEELVHQFLQLRENDPQVAYAYNTFDNRGSSPLFVQPKNMGAYLPYHPRAILEHGDFRWAQKAPVTLVGMGFRKPPRGGEEAITLGSRIEGGKSIQNPSEEIRLKVYSNGIRGMIHFMDA